MLGVKYYHFYEKIDSKKTAHKVLIIDYLVSALFKDKSKT